MPVSDAAEIRGGKLKTPAGDAPLIPLVMMLTGGYLCWFAVHYWRDTRTTWPSDPVKSVLQGKGLPPPSRSAPESDTLAQNEADLQDGSPGGSPAGSTTGQAIADDALKYKGAGYVLGGAPAKGIGNWDCSSFANKVIGIDLGLAIPGYAAGQYDGSVHGPVVSSWIAWSGVSHLGPGQQIQPGDLCAWPGGANGEHIGIAISATQMISAENQTDGTNVSDINGFFAVPPVVLRLKASVAPAPVPGAPSSGTVKKNQQTANLLAGKYGWASTQDKNQWDSLVALWNGESGWSTTAENPSGAYGIPQSLPGSKMARFGANWRTSAKVQITWGLWYIRTVYGDPATAYQTWLSRNPHWY